MLGLLDKKFSGGWVVVVGSIAIIVISSRSRSVFEIDFEIETDFEIEI